MPCLEITRRSRLIHNSQLQVIKKRAPKWNPFISLKATLPMQYIALSSTLGILAGVLVIALTKVLSPSTYSQLLVILCPLVAIPIAQIIVITRTKSPTLAKLTCYGFAVFPGFLASIYTAPIMVNTLQIGDSKDTLKAAMAFVTVSVVTGIFLKRWLTTKDQETID